MKSSNETSEQQEKDASVEMPQQKVETKNW